MKFTFAVALLTTTISANDSNSTEFTKWKNDLDENSLKEIYSSYINKAPRRLAPDDLVKPIVDGISDAAAKLKAAASGEVVVTPSME